MTMKVSIATVLECVSNAFGVSVHELRSARRPNPLAHARQAAYLLALELTGHGSTTIGRRMGGRDHSTICHGVEKARERYASDEEYAVKVEAARQAALIITASSLGKRMGDADPIIAAERICHNPSREATRVSTDEILAMAARLLDLEDTAGTTFQLLLKLDELASLQPAYSTADRIRWRELVPVIKALTETLASALGSLGYTMETSNDEDESQGAGDGPARAAIA